jgi:histidyl-tRNA synthetase
VGGGGRYDDLIPLMGGGDVPASGFALYLDYLMNLVKPEAVAEPVAQRILIRAEPEVVKDGFSVADDLREAGYVAEVDLGGRKPADLRWTLDVQSKAPRFVLTDQVESRKLEAQTAAEVLALLAK